ncbi:GGDEF domain-containing protein [Shewanella sp. SM29]|uniref:GGDEF domain-containing protein n=1 Tax=Shewanella sp. SM29 TaxID=2912795 RepID=UPI0021D9D262|nr:sensor domain-containing diguanylate cyclase [Shewanella sp. SM29]MCU8076905.1 diguanylate cyclase [Shewanella sp. SM29]
MGNYIADINDINDINDTLFKSVFNKTKSGMALATQSGQIVKVNQSILSILGYSEEYLLSIDLRQLTKIIGISNDFSKVEGDLIILKEVDEQEVKLKIAFGGYVWALLSIYYVCDHAVNYYIIQIQGIDKRKKHELRIERQKKSLNKINMILERMATEDFLTEVANRRQFEFWFNHQISRVKQLAVPISIAIVDIDLFKSYNDEHGHLEGDIALKYVAKTLSDNLRNQDKIARFGGEEFTILMPNTNENNCILVCERLRECVEKLSILKRNVTVSIGAIVYIQHSGSTVKCDTLLGVADKNLYEAKYKGRNQVKVTTLDLI